MTGGSRRLYTLEQCEVKSADIFLKWTIIMVQNDSHGI